VTEARNSRGGRELSKRQVEVLFVILVAFLCFVIATAIPGWFRWWRAELIPGYPRFQIPQITPATLDSVLADEVRILRAQPGFQDAEFRRLRIVRIDGLALTDADRENGIKRARCYTIAGIYKQSASTPWGNLPHQGLAYVVMKDGSWFVPDSADLQRKWPGLCPCQK
jgi:hypothetical protein